MEGGGYGGGAKWDTGDTGDAPENGIITARQLKGGAERHCDAPYLENEAATRLWNQRQLESPLKGNL